MIGPVPAPVAFKRSVSETLVPQIRVTSDAAESGMRKRYYARELGGEMAGSSTRVSAHEAPTRTPDPHFNIPGREWNNDAAPAHGHGSR